MPGQTGGAGAVIVDFSGCTEAGRPIWFASQNGASTWTRVQSTDAIYRFTVSAAAGGYAFAARSGTATSVTVNLLTHAELTSTPIDVCPSPAGNKVVTLTVAGVGANQGANVNLGGSSVSVPSSVVVTAPALVSFTHVPNGTFDLVTWRYNSARGLNTATDSKGVIVRDLNLADGGSAGTVSFDAETSVPIQWPVTFTGANPGETFSGSMSYFTGPRASCRAARLYDFTNTVAAVPVGGWGFAASQQRPTDFYVLRAVATGTNSTRIVQRSFHNATDGSFLHFATPVSPPVITDVGGAAYKRLQVVGTTPVDYTSSTSFSYSTLDNEKTGTILATVAWLGGNAASLGFPDFTLVSGWDNSWMPSASPSVLWTFGGTASSFSGAPCIEGALLRAGYISGVK